MRAALLPPGCVDILTCWHWACQGHLLSLGSLHKIKRAVVPASQFQKLLCLLGFETSIEITHVCQAFLQRKIRRRFPEHRFWTLSTGGTSSMTLSCPTLKLSSDVPASEACFHHTVLVQYCHELCPGRLYPPHPKLVQPFLLPTVFISFFNKVSASSLTHWLSLSPSHSICQSWYQYSEEKVIQSCLTLCNPLDYTAHGILQARILEWVPFHSLSPGDLPNPGIEPRSPTLQADSLPAEPPMKPRY